MRIVGPPLSPSETAAFVAHARSHVALRTRFRHMGRTPRGMDCAGLVLWSMQQAGRPVRDIAAYGREPHKDGLRDNLVANLGQPVDLADMRAGDVALMRFEGEPRHVGIIGAHPEGGLSLIHVHAHNKHVSEHRLDAFWSSTVVEVFRP